MFSNVKIDQIIINAINAGGIGVLPTDTLYGLVGSAFNRQAVERIYKLKKRDPKKPMIVLIGSLHDLMFFGVWHLVSDTCLTPFWPGKVSIILPCSRPEFSYLHRGTKTLAFRLPKPKWLQVLLKKTGPLVAPSANPESEKPAETIKQAKKYFGHKVDFYFDGGTVSGEPSTLIEIKNNNVIIKRQGAIKIQKSKCKAQN